MPRLLLVTEPNREWVAEGLTQSCEHPTDAPFAVQSLLLESRRPVRAYLATWSTIGFTLGGFVLSAGLGVDDPAARWPMIAAALVLLVGCGAGGLALSRTSQQVTDALVWWAAQDMALQERVSWARLRRHAGVVLPVATVALAVVTLAAWLLAAMAVASGDLVLVPTFASAALALNVAIATSARGALKRARIEPRGLPEVE